MDEALGWLHWLPKDLGMIVEAVSRGVRKTTLARKLHCDPVTIRRKFQRGCEMIAETLNRK